MPNPYFSFKQFTVYHNQCAMKVCTDACILGAWFADKIPADSNVLDVGSGSGLLMLMLAQKTGGLIHGIEKDHASFLQSKNNIGNSNWSDRLEVLEGDAAVYDFSRQYDFIITNPPFYANDLKSADAAKNLAKHDTGLTLESLTAVIDRHLTTDGSFGILLPYHRTAEYEAVALRFGFYPAEKVLIRQTPKHDYFRSMLHFKRTKSASLATKELMIMDVGGIYTAAFIGLLRDYYLHL